MVHHRMPFGKHEDDTESVLEKASANASRFIGWFRLKRWHDWRPAIEAADEDNAWRLLLAHTQGGEKCVLPAGKHPDGRTTDLARRSQ